MGSEQTYRDAPGLSGSQVASGLISMAHLKAAMNEPRSVTPAMTLGSLTHAWVLEGESVARSRYPVVGNCIAELSSGTRKGQSCGNSGTCLSESGWLCGVHSKGVKSLIAEGTEFVTQEDIVTASKIAAAVAAHPHARSLLTGGEAEVEIFGEWNGAPIKGKIDYRNDVFVSDLKTFGKPISEWTPGPSEILQACHYLHLGKRAAFCWIVAETSAPYTVAVYGLDLADAAKASIVHTRILDQWAVAWGTGIFPGPATPEEPAMARIKPWTWEAMK